MKSIDNNDRENLFRDILIGCVVCIRKVSDVDRNLIYAQKRYEYTKGEIFFQSKL